MRIISVLSYDPQAFMRTDGTFATIRITDGRIKATVEVKKRKHLAYFEYKGIRYIVHNTGHLIAPIFELVGAA